MTWVKLCGMGSAADVAAAVDAGADAVGLVVAPVSVRRISLDQAATLARACPIECYLVTDDMPPGDLVAAAHRTGVSGVQPHGAHATDAAQAALGAGFRVLFPIEAGREISLGSAPEGTVPLIDTTQPGSGVAVDRTLVTALRGRFVLAGGLTPDTVGEVVASVRPYGVDVSSGIERRRGIKDHGLMRQFVEAVR